MGRVSAALELNSIWIAGLAGLVCGILSGFGIGGGSLLMVWMTAVAALDQKTAQGINLLYFLPTSIGALIFHIKNKMICWRVVIPAAVCGCVTAALAAWISASLDVSFLRKLFGGYLLIIGVMEIFKKSPKSK